MLQSYDSDFCRNLGDWRGHWIVISVDFDELSSHEGCRMLKHMLGMDGSEKGTQLIISTLPENKKALFEASSNQVLAQQIIDEITIEDYEHI